jgi:uncharacterized protein
MNTDASMKSAIRQRVLDSRSNRVENLQNMRDRQQEGLQVARKCAVQLKQEFGVSRVVLFGSLLEPEGMWWGSDIDLAVWDLPDSLYLKAGAALERGHDFQVDLVNAQLAKPHMLEAIEQGMELE